MSGDSTPFTIRVPAQTRKGGPFEPRWTAALDLGEPWQGNSFRVSAGTRAEAGSALTQLVVQALALMAQGPILVIGGDGQYADHLHLIHAQPGGWVVPVIRYGRCTRTWAATAAAKTCSRRSATTSAGSPGVVRL